MRRWGRGNFFIVWMILLVGIALGWGTVHSTEAQTFPTRGDTLVIDELAFGYTPNEDSIILSEEGYPLFLYAANDSGARVSFVRCGDAACSTLDNSIDFFPFDPGVGDPLPTIEVSGGGGPVFAFLNQPNQVQLQICDNSACISSVTRLITTPADVQSLALTLTLGDRPVLVYIDDLGAVRTIVCDDPACNTQTLQDTTEDAVLTDEVNASIDTDGSLVISYMQDQLGTGDPSLQLLTCVGLDCTASGRQSIAVVDGGDLDVGYVITELGDMHLGPFNASRFVTFTASDDGDTRLYTLHCPDDCATVGTRTITAQNFASGANLNFNSSVSEPSASGLSTIYLHTDSFDVPTRLICADVACSSSIQEVITFTDDGSEFTNSAGLNGAIVQSGGEDYIVFSSEYDTSLRFALLGQPLLATITVNDARDLADFDTSDGLCDASSAEAGLQCTLRAAIETANNSANEVIGFDFGPLSTPQLISPTSELPVITQPLELIGLTQPGATCARPLVRVDGSNIVGADGLVIQADNVTINGLLVTSWSNGLVVGSGGVNAANTIIDCNFIGLDADGLGSVTDLGNARGVLVQNATNLVIGGDGAAPAAEQRNVFGFNSIALFLTPLADTSGTRISGNYFGFGPLGTENAGNGFALRVAGSGAAFALDTLIGVDPTATDPLAMRNWFGYNADGIDLEGNITQAVIAGNVIGTDVNGNPATNIGDGIGITGDNVRDVFIGTSDTPGAPTVLQNYIGNVTGNGIAITNNLPGARDNIEISGNFIGVATPADPLAGTPIGGAGISVQAPVTNLIIGVRDGSNPANEANYIGATSGNGIEITGGGVDVPFILGNRIGLAPDDASIVPGGGDGIFLDSTVNPQIGLGADALPQPNYVVGSAGTGLLLRNISGGATVAHNVIGEPPGGAVGNAYANAGDGLVIANYLSGPAFVVNDNSVVWNQRSGVVLEAALLDTFQNNRIENNDYAGLVYGSFAGADVADPTDDVEVQYDAATIPNLSGNQLTDNCAAPFTDACGVILALDTGFARASANALVNGGGFSFGANNGAPEFMQAWYGAAELLDTSGTPQTSGSMIWSSADLTYTYAFDEPSNCINGPFVGTTLFTVNPPAANPCRDYSAWEIIPEYDTDGSTTNEHGPYTESATGSSYDWNGLADETSTGGAPTAIDVYPSTAYARYQVAEALPAAGSLVVNSTADAADANVGDGLCATPANECTLRAAIQTANEDAAEDTITFNIPGAGVQVITPDALETGTYNELITTPMVIDASTQPGATCDVPLVRVDGPGRGIIGAQAFEVDAGGAGTVIRGFQMGNYNQAVRLRDNADATFECNFIGLYVDENGVLNQDANATGNTTGIFVTDNTNALRIGSDGSVDSDDQRNIFGYNDFGVVLNGASDNFVIAGNYFGFGPDGTSAFINGVPLRIGVGGFGGRVGVDVTTSFPERMRNYFGHYGRLIDGSSLSASAGIVVQGGSDHVIQGNSVGIAPSGLGAGSFTSDGIRITNATNILIGTAGDNPNGALEGNFISNINGSGIQVGTTFVTDAPSNITVSGNSIGVGSPLDPNATYGNSIAGINVTGQVTSLTIGRTLTPPSNPELQGNVIGNNSIRGISLGGDPLADDMRISGNRIGLAPDGSAAGNGVQGITAENVTNLVIGGATADDGNLIGYNIGSGIEISSAVAPQILNNRIGVAPDGSDIGNGGGFNGGGVVLFSTASATVQGNVIGFNGDNGLYVSGGNNIVIDNNQIGIVSGALANKGNDRFGVQIFNHVNPTISNNLVGNHSENGITLFGTTGGGDISFNDIGYDPADDTVPQGNGFVGLGLTNIFDQEISVTENTIRYNTLTNSNFLPLSAVNIQGALVDLQRNLIEQNGQSGLLIHPYNGNSNDVSPGNDFVVEAVGGALGADVNTYSDNCTQGTLNCAHVRVVDTQLADLPNFFANNSISNDGVPAFAQFWFGATEFIDGGVVQSTGAFQMDAATTDPNFTTNFAFSAGFSDPCTSGLFSGTTLFGDGFSMCTLYSDSSWFTVPDFVTDANGNIIAQFNPYTVSGDAVGTVNFDGDAANDTDTGGYASQGEPFGFDPLNTFQRYQVQEVTPAAVGGGLIVNDTGDDPDAAPGDGLCATASSACTLRAALEEANATPGLDTITFDIPAGFANPNGRFTILVNAVNNDADPAVDVVLPPITDPVVIDGSTQPGASVDPSAPNFLITIDGTNTLSTRGSFGNPDTGPFVDIFVQEDPIFFDTVANPFGFGSSPQVVGMLTIANGGSGSTIRGLVFNAFDGSAIDIESSSNNKIYANVFGMTADGTDTNAVRAGVNILGDAQNNTIGVLGVTEDGFTPALQANYFSGISNTTDLDVNDRVPAITVGSNLTSYTGANDYSGLKISGNVFGTGFTAVGAPEAELANFSGALDFNGSADFSSVGATTSLIIGTDLDGQGDAFEGNYIANNDDSLLAVQSTQFLRFSGNTLEFDAGLVAINGVGDLIVGTNGLDGGGPLVANTFTDTGLSTLFVGFASGVVAGNRIEGAQETAIDIGEWSGRLVIGYDPLLTDVTPDVMRNVIVSSDRRGFNIIGENPGAPLIVQGNYIGLEGDGLTPGSIGRSGMRFQNSDETGVGVRNVIVRENVIGNAGWFGIWFDLDFGGPPADDVLIENNRIGANVFGSAAPNAGGILIPGLPAAGTGASDIIIRGNVIANSTGYPDANFASPGIVVRSDGVLIEDNSINGNDGPGILAEGFSGDPIFGPARSPVQVNVGTNRVGFQTTVNNNAIADNCAASSRLCAGLLLIDMGLSNANTVSGSNVFGTQFGNPQVQQFWRGAFEVYDTGALVNGDTSQLFDAQGNAALQLAAQSTCTGDVAAQQGPALYTFDRLLRDFDPATEYPLPLKVAPALPTGDGASFTAPFACDDYLTWDWVEEFRIDGATRTDYMPLFADAARTQPVYDFDGQLETAEDLLDQNGFPALTFDAALENGSYQVAELGGVVEPPVTIIVDDGRDLPDLNLVDGVCDADPAAGQQCTLRAAIDTANANTTAPLVTIQFAIGDLSDTTTVRTITLDNAFSDFEFITRPLVIDGLSQPGSVCNGADSPAPLVRIDGSNLGTFTDGISFNVGAAGSALYGLTITNFRRYGVWALTNDIALGCNVIGVDENGLAAGNGNGVQLSENVFDAQIGGVAAPLGRNIIAGNVTGISSNAFNLAVVNNYIGLNAAGVAVPNQVGIASTTDEFSNPRTLIGTDGDGVNDALEGNVISGNAATGLAIDEAELIPSVPPRDAAGSNPLALTLPTNGVRVSGNIIGLAPDGVTVIPNGNGTSGSAGIQLVNANAVLIGADPDAAPLPEEANIISGNDGPGILISSASNVGIYANRIGTDRNGSVVNGNGYIGNNGAGLRVDSGATITVGSTAFGGTLANRIEANQFDGVTLNSSIDVLVAGNTIGGLDAANRQGQSGVRVSSQTATATIRDNALRFHRGSGVLVEGGEATLAGNTITDNGGPGVSINPRGRFSPETPGDDFSAQPTFSTASVNTISNNCQTIFGVCAGVYAIDSVLPPLADLLAQNIFDNTVLNEAGNAVGDIRFLQAWNGLAEVLDDEGNPVLGLTVTLNSSPAAFTQVLDDTGTCPPQLNNALVYGADFFNDGFDCTDINDYGDFADYLVLDGDDTVVEVAYIDQATGTRFSFDSDASDDADDGDTGSDSGLGAPQGLTGGDGVLRYQVMEINTEPLVIGGIIVNDTSDASDFDPADGVCDADSAAPGQQCTLRAAIQTANEAGPGQTITFQIGDSADTSVRVINLTSALPPLPSATTINGLTQFGATCAADGNPAPRVRLDGVDRSFDGLRPTSAGAVYGLILTDFSNAITVQANDVKIGCNVLGLTSATGDPAANDNGVLLGSSASAAQVGGSNAPLGRNIFAGNRLAGIRIAGIANSVANNYIGLDANATAKPNTTGIVLAVNSSAGRNRIGTDGDGVDDALEGNVISGNTSAGIVVFNVFSPGTAEPPLPGQESVGIGMLVAPAAQFNTIAGNRIGTAPDGLAALPNGDSGIIVEDSQRVIIGANLDGSVPDEAAVEGNLISGNAGDGISIRNGGENVRVYGNIIGPNAALGRLTGPGYQGNGVDGIHVETGGSSIVIGAAGDAGRNLIGLNQFSGIVVDFANNTQIVNNLIGGLDAANKQLGAGIILGQDTTGVVIRDNDIAFNVLAGIIAGSAQATLSGNTIRESDFAGIYLLPDHQGDRSSESFADDLFPQFTLSTSEPNTITNNCTVNRIDCAGITAIDTPLPATDQIRAQTIRNNPHAFAFGELSIDAAQHWRGAVELLDPNNAFAPVTGETITLNSNLGAYTEVFNVTDTCPASMNGATVYGGGAGFACGDAFTWPIVTDYVLLDDETTQQIDISFTDAATGTVFHFDADRSDDAGESGADSGSGAPAGLPENGVPSRFQVMEIAFGANLGPTPTPTLTPTPTQTPEPPPAGITIQTFGPIQGFDVQVVMSGGLPRLATIAPGANLALRRCADLACSSVAESVLDTFAGWPSMTVNSAGNPVIAYVFQDDQLNVLTCGDPDCSSSTSVNIAGGEAVVHVDLALAPGDLPYVVYQNADDGSLNAAYCDTPDCTGGNVFEVTLDGDAATIAGAFADVEFDSAGRPVIAYQRQTTTDGVTNRSLFLLACNDLACQTPRSGPVRVDDAADDNDEGNFLSLQLSASDIPYITHHDDSTGSLKLEICTDPLCAVQPSIIRELLPSTPLNGGAPQPTPDVAATVAARPTVVPGVDVPRLGAAGADPTLPPTADPFAVGIAPTPAPLVLDTGGVGLYTSLQLAANGAPNIAFYDEQNGDLRYVACADALCTASEIFTVDSVGDVGTFTGMALAGSSALIGYRDQDTTNLKYALCADCVDGSPTGDPTPTPSPTPTATPDGEATEEPIDDEPAAEEPTITLDVPDITVNPGGGTSVGGTIINDGPPIDEVVITINFPPEVIVESVDSSQGTVVIVDSVFVTGGVVVDLGPVVTAVPTATITPGLIINSPRGDGGGPAGGAAPTATATAPAVVTLAPTDEASPTPAGGGAGVTGPQPTPTEQSGVIINQPRWRLSDPRGWLVGQLAAPPAQVGNQPGQVTLNVGTIPTGGRLTFNVDLRVRSNVRPPYALPIEAQLNYAGAEQPISATAILLSDITQLPATGETPWYRDVLFSLPLLLLALLGAAGAWMMRRQGRGNATTES